ncbi:MAG TPA: GAF domain-containing protein, partial [Bradyrhizobium sp.]|nr:GAF domain-containing protein [Bradyrhizobium sp.]
MAKRVKAASRPAAARKAPGKRRRLPAPGNIDPKKQIQNLERALRVSLQQQTATADVLKVISRSTFDLQTVLQTLVESAARLCEADLANIWRPKGATYHLAASFGLPGKDREWLENVKYLGTIGIEPGHWSIVGRALLQRKTVQISDAQADPEYRLTEIVRIGDYRTMLGVPLLREEVPIGVIVLTRCKVQPFTDQQIELVSTFADQAVIAIENVRLFDEVQARTLQLTESLEYQTAISSVLNVISRSPSNIQPVLDTIAETAQRLCRSEHAYIMRLENDRYHLAAAKGARSERIKYLEQNPIARDRGSVVGRVALEHRPVHIPDVLADPEYALSMEGDHGYRTILGIPLLRDGSAIGIIIVTRAAVQPFEPRQIELVSTFADQALIAIENARLFEEVRARTEDLRESLQQQTATADVLKVISRSAFDLQTVLDTLTESAARLCNADMAAILRQDARGFYNATNYKFAVDWFRLTDPLRFQPERGSVIGRVLLARAAVQIPDVLADPEYAYSDMQKAAG